MSIIQTAKDLLRKGIALNDEELIQMANSLLTEQGDSETPVQPVKEEVVTRDSSVERASADDFTVKREQPQQRKVPVNEMGSRKNSFVDDGTEHTDMATPDFVPTQRRKAPKKSSNTVKPAQRHLRLKKFTVETGSSVISVWRTEEDNASTR